MLFRRLFLAMVLLAAVVAVAAREEGTADRKLNIDPALRKALLRALRHLKERQEEEKQDQQQQQLGDANTTEENFATTILDELLEESTVADGAPVPSFQTYVANAREDDTIEGEVEQRDTGAVAIGSADANEIIKTIIIAKPKASPVLPKLESENEIVPVVGSDSQPGTTVAPTSTTTQQPEPVSTTLSPVPTTPAPTHNEDGENIEQVKSEDVKIFQAPLVAAFTVQQDQLGVPRNVIPLLQTPPKQQQQPAAGTDFKPSPVILPAAPSVLAPLQPVPPTQALLAPLKPSAGIGLSTRALEEKTHQLEQQLIALQNQQRAQEQLLRAKLQQEQAIIHQQQQQLQQQKQRLEEETRLRIQRFEQEQRLFRQQQQQFQQQQQQFQQQPPSQQQLPPFKPQPLPLQQQQQQPQLPLAPQPTFVQELPRPGPAVQFIPSVSLPGGKPIPISVEQQLPFKEAVDFQPQQPPQQQQQQQQGVQTTTSVEQVKALSQPPQLARDQALPLKPFQPFNLFPVLPPLLLGPSPFDQQQLPPLQQRNRVFRQEPPFTGNFGLNGGPPPQQQQQAPFRPSQPLAFNGQQQQQSLTDSQNLQNLLFQSGITSRSAEDFNIITKVLALNHGIPQASSQRMFAKLSPDQQRQLLFRK